jgi:hypothetical protein
MQVDTAATTEVPGRQVSDLVRLPKNNNRSLCLGCAISALFQVQRKRMHCSKIVLFFSPYGYSKEKCVFPSSPGLGD